MLHSQQKRDDGCADERVAHDVGARDVEIDQQDVKQAERCRDCRHDQKHQMESELHDNALGAAGAGLRRPLGLP